MGLFFKSVPQAKACVVERFKIYNKTLKTGIHFLLPGIDKQVNFAVYSYEKVDGKIVEKKTYTPYLPLNEQTLDVQPVEMITKDNATVTVDVIVYYQITDPKLYRYGVENVHNAFKQMTVTTLRSIIGGLSFDETLTARDSINAKMSTIIDEATDPWGIKVNRVELQAVMPNKSVLEAMNQQKEAEAYKLAAIQKAEGDKTAQILEAEGRKTAQILDAEAEKEAAILKAQAEKESILRAGEAEAEAIRLIDEAKPSEAYLMLKKLEALEKLADGQATKLVIPTELQSVVSLVNTAKEVK